MALREQGRRARRGPFAVVFVADAASQTGAPHPRVAFAIGRRAGSAVVRNRIRRRARAALDRLSAQPGSPLIAGSYLVSADARAVDLPFPEVQRLLDAAVRAVTQVTPPGGPS